MKNLTTGVLHQVKIKLFPHDEKMILAKSNIFSWRNLLRVICFEVLGHLQPLAHLPIAQSSQPHPSFPFDYKKPIAWSYPIAINLRIHYSPP